MREGSRRRGDVIYYIDRQREVRDRRCKRDAETVRERETGGVVL